MKQVEASDDMSDAFTLFISLSGKDSPFDISPYFSHHTSICELQPVAPIRTSGFRSFLITLWEIKTRYLSNKQATYLQEKDDINRFYHEKSNHVNHLAKQAETVTSIDSVDYY